MKNQSLFFPSFLMMMFLFLAVYSCTPKSANKLVSISDKEIEVNYNKSLQKWNAVKQLHNNSYEYHVSFSSWVGYRSTTKVMVKNGIVVAREFSETKRNKENDRFEQEETIIYTEDKSNLNSHEQGRKGITLDKVYENCGQISLQADPVLNQIYFGTDDATGIILSCGYRLKNCADDCSDGIYIDTFNWLE